jgi:hypothetical protein
VIFRNENIGLVVSVAILIVGQLVTGWDPNRAESALIVVLMVGSGLGLSMYLNERDRRRGRGLQRLPFRR